MTKKNRKKTQIIKIRHDRGKHKIKRIIREYYEQTSCQ